MSDENYDGAVYHVQEVDDTFEGAIYHVKVVEGGGDKHNLGYYATQAALEEAHPTAEAGDWAIVGATDTVWIWDTDNSAWVDSDQKGQVTSVNNRTGAVTVSEVPSQTGNSGKFLTTDGTDASWSDKPLVNVSNSYLTLGIGTEEQYAKGQLNTIIHGKVTNNNANSNVVIGINASFAYKGEGNVIIGEASVDSTDSTVNNSISIGHYARSGKSNSISIGSNVRTSATNAIQLGFGTGTMNPYNNSDANTFKVGNANGNYEIMSADGTIPTARLTNAINKYSTMPTAASTNEGWIVQFTGTTDANYTHGYIYECKAQGTTPETYAWEAVEVQASSGGGLQNTATGTGSLTILGNANLYTNGVNIGVNANCGSSDSVAIGYSANDGGNGVTIGRFASSAASVYGGVAIGNYAQVGGSGFQMGVAIGTEAKTTANDAIQLGNGTNSEAGTFSVGLNNNGTRINAKLLNSDGTIPTARLTKVNTTVTLAAADWSSNTQTVSVTGVTATGVIFVSPDPSDQADYTSAGITCTAQAAGTLTFTCDTTPSNDIDVVVVQL